MIEARAFIPELESARAVLESEGALFKGFYKIHDTIFCNSVTGAPLHEEFLRLRHVPVNIWDEKSVILAIKKTIAQQTGKISDIPTKIQFDTVEEAREYYEAHLQNTYTQDYSFWRDGWQYALANGDIVDLEIVEDVYPTIELKSKSNEGIQALLTTFSIPSSQIIQGPSVTAVRELLNIS